MKSLHRLILGISGAAALTLGSSAAVANIGGNGGFIGMNSNPWLNIGGNGGFIGMNSNPWLNIGGNGGFIGMNSNPWLNIGGNGGFIGMNSNPWLNIHGGGGFIGIHDANGAPIPVQNIGGNGGFITVAQPAEPQPVLCKLKDQVLIAGALESCEKAGGKAVDPKATAAK